MNTRVALVGCSSTKLTRRAPARDLYTSALFKKSVAFAEATCERWYVLSALHGLVRPDAELDPYDAKLGSKNGPPVWDWARRVQGQLAIELRDVPRVTLVALAGEQYRTVLHPCAWPFEIPMKGLGIGEQLAYLTNAIAAHREPAA